MKSLYTLVILSFTFFCPAQVDTIVWDLDASTPVNTKQKDGYHILKKNGIILSEFNIVNGKLTGLNKQYYDNGKPRRFAEFSPYQNYNFSFMNGSYRDFYESGKLKTEGKCELADSVECISCFDLTDMRQITKAQTRSKRVGTWKEYSENGLVKAEGVYKGVHETMYYRYAKPDPEPKGPVFTPGDYSEEYVKDGVWKYYNEKGALIKEEFYFQGLLCQVETYEQ